MAYSHVYHVPNPIKLMPNGIVIYLHHVQLRYGINHFVVWHMVLHMTSQQPTKGRGLSTQVPVAPAVFVVGLHQQVVIAQLHVLIVAMFMKTQLNQESCHQGQGIQCAHQTNPRVFLIQIVVIVLFFFLLFIILRSILIIDTGILAGFWKRSFYCRRRLVFFFLLFILFALLLLLFVTITCQ